MVTTSVVPSAIGSGLPRILPMMTARPSTLRAAVAPSATMVAGLTIAALQLQPHLAALDLVCVRPLVQPALAAHLVLEVLDRIGDEDFLARDAGIRQRLVEDAPGGPDERLAGQVLLVARLLADQHEGARRGPSPGTAWVASL